MDRAVEPADGWNAALEAPAVGAGVQDLADQPDLDHLTVVVAAAPTIVLERGDDAEGAADVPCRRTTWPISAVLAASASITPQIMGPATEITRPMRAPGVSVGLGFETCADARLGLNAGAAAWAP